MNMKLFLLNALLLVGLTPLTALADEWQDPATKVNYFYTPGIPSAIVTYSPDAVNANIQSAIIVDNQEYVVNKVAMWAFRLSENLQSATIPSSITIIGNQAFANCYKLESVSFAEGLQIIEDAAFHACTSLQSIHLPASVKLCGSPFQLCYNLKEITVAESNTEFDSRNNCNAIIRKSDGWLIQGCCNTVIPADVNAIGYYAFEYCQDLTSISIPSNVEKLMSCAFMDCHYLTSLTLNEGLKEIFNQAFAGCKEITEIRIPKSVTSIMTNAFGARVFNLMYPDSVSFSSRFSFS